VRIIQLNAGMGGISVPIRDETGAIIGALSIGAASERIGSREDALADMLKREAATLTRSLAVSGRKAPALFSSRSTRAG
jgi:DNA-binding IclR family transcriptional regulator